MTGVERGPGARGRVGQGRVVARHLENVGNRPVRRRFPANPRWGTDNVGNLASAEMISHVFQVRRPANRLRVSSLRAT